MPAKKTPALQEIYQIKVTLLGSSPPIWRRLLMPANVALSQLHHALQIAMGWEDCHMHEFLIGQNRFGVPETGDPTIDDESTVRLSSVLRRVGAKAVYTYDFGDTWEHSIVLEKRLPAEPALTYPVCTAGQCACPPEDCGGIFGFYDLLDAIRDPKHDQHEEMKDWVDPDFDPAAFSIEDVNRAFARVRRRRGIRGAGDTR